MAKQKDELISGSELARRINVAPQYITKQKAKLKDAKCMFGNKYYYEKSADYLGKNSNDPHKSRQSNLQTDIKATKKETTKKETPESDENWTVTTDKKEIKKVVESSKPQKKIAAKPKDEDTEPDQENEAPGTDDDAKSLLEQILKAIKDGNNAVNRNELDLLRQKAGVLREYFTAKNEEIKNRKLEENLFERDEVVKILSFAMNMIRNSLINLPNNYAVNLDGLNQKEIKEFVTDDINKILEDLQSTENQFN